MVGTASAETQEEAEEARLARVNITPTDTSSREEFGAAGKAKPNAA
jgi:hypothetical protein